MKNLREPLEKSKGSIRKIKRYPLKNLRVESKKKSSKPLSRKEITEGGDSPINIKDNYKVILQDKKGLFPDSLNTESFIKAWESWGEYRREKKKKLTPSTIKLQLKMLAVQPDPAAVINKSIENGWTGLFPIKEGYKNETNKRDNKFQSRLNQQSTAGTDGEGEFNYLTSE